MIRTELIPYDSHKSFYGKAYFDYDEGNTYYCYSYDTLVATIIFIIIIICICGCIKR